jgi:hypothetical protein
MWQAARNRMLAQLEPAIMARVEIELERAEAELLGRVEAQLSARIMSEKISAEAIAESIKNPTIGLATVAADSPFMSASTCAANDVMHPRYREICTMLQDNPRWHRKQWEWVFIIHHLLASGVVRPGCRGLGFGVGREALPALFASFGAEVVATDAPEDGLGWSETNEHSSSREHLRAPWMVSNEDFDRLITHRPADMNAIPADLRGFDFTWSACCFEHLGSLQAGIDFVVNSVERLKPGGIAVHTTEFNVTSNDETLTEGPTVIYRRRDLEALVTRLRDLGHDVAPFLVSPNSHVIDNHVDAPPYALPHMKLLLANHVTTSAGIVVRRGLSGRQRDRLVSAQVWEAARIK